MAIKNIVDEFNRELQIDEETRKLYEYSNKSHTITYNAQIVENAKHTGFWTNYTECGMVDSIEERLEVWNNKILLLYAASVGFNASENDPNKEKYNRIVDFVKANPEKFFTKTGDFRKKFLVSDEEIKGLI